MTSKVEKNTNCKLKKKTKRDMQENEKEREMDKEECLYFSCIDTRINIYIDI